MQERTYRQKVKTDLYRFRVVVKETDLWVSADRDLEKQTADLVFQCRHQLESYIQHHPGFSDALSPLPRDPYAPSIVREMLAVTHPLGVGPMAAVAGAIAQFVGEGLLGSTEQVVVENGGDIYLKMTRPATVSIMAAHSRLSGKIGLRISPEQMPLGVCSSSGTVGHSMSLGLADVVCLLSPSAALADAAATSLGNRIRSRKDLQQVPRWAKSLDGVLGGVAVLGDAMASWGGVELVALEE